MELEPHIELVASWIDGVDIETAPGRIAAFQSQNFAKEALGLTAAGGQVERAAWHESAHSVTAHRLGLDVGRACVRADGSGSAAYTASEARADTLLATVIASLAGIFGELLIGADHRRQFELAHGCDILSARVGITECKTHAPNWILESRTFAVLACCTVVSSWQEIARVARALRLCGELDGAAVRALCGPLQ
jgi:hypothetical protein